ncbi:MAG TPA: hypothetical protein DEA55_01350 [Rhodospirillaceae bacterium]|nr:hypothetical protein [Rhodospirillaceae bacterium]
MRIPGATQFANAASLANARGVAPSAPTLLSQNESTASLLEQGRDALRVRGFGISGRARAINSQYLSQSTSLGNRILSLSVGTDATVEGARQQIMAIRGRMSDDRLAPFLRGSEVDKEA